MREHQQIEDQMMEASIVASEGRTQYPAMSYEEGVRDALAWVIEESDDAPMEGDE